MTSTQRRLHLCAWLVLVPLAIAAIVQASFATRSSPASGAIAAPLGGR